ncbi:hypothetical protein [Anabaena sp. CCY 9910]|uniref:hypothetical protein n=1 Tax=Anabaena sp. CCY 9910 TaxID=3103870 RepID=UPI0039E135D1
MLNNRKFLTRRRREKQLRVPTLRERLTANALKKLALLISGMIFVSRKGAKAQRINILLCTKVSIHPAFMQRQKTNLPPIPPTSQY